MAEEFDERKQRNYINRRAIMDLGMGLIYTGMAVIMANVFAEPFNYIFGGLCLLYGGFRVYRGIKKDYLK